jgi:hypothetical protein
MLKFSALWTCRSSVIRFQQVKASKLGLAVQRGLAS